MTQINGNPDSGTRPADLCPLKGRNLLWSVTSALILLNLLVACAMWLAGAGMSHSSTSIQMAWGANFGPATKDGQWWRLGSAMFLHFGVWHLGMNMFALYDSGRMVERVFGPVRYLAIYVVSGLVGNMLTLFAQGDRAVSGGASGAIFGVYGALLVFLWMERSRLHPGDFKWLFWGGLCFVVVTLGFGSVVPGIDNGAHVGGLIAGTLMGFVLLRDDATVHQRAKGLAVILLALLIVVMIAAIPEPRYRWSEEELARREVAEFKRTDVRINIRLRDILNQAKREDVSIEQLAGQIEAEVTASYQRSVEHLAGVRVSPMVPSAQRLDALRRVAEQRRDAAHALAEGVRAKDPGQIKEALKNTGVSIRKQPDPPQP